MYNQPVYTTDRFTVGPATILIGPAGTTPTVDVGALKGKATLTIERSEVEIRQGSPQTLVAKLCKQEDVSFEFSGIEWNMDRLAQVIMDGTTSLVSAQEILKVGGRPNAQAWAIRVIHKMADGGTVEIDMWKVLGDSKFTAILNEADTHDLQYKFWCMDPGSTDWAGAALTDGQKLVKISRTKA